MRKEISCLQRGMRAYTGEDIDFSSMTYEDLDQLEKQLEQSVTKVRTRKVYMCLFNYLQFKSFLVSSTRSKEAFPS